MDQGLVSLHKVKHSARLSEASSRSSEARALKRSDALWATSSTSNVAHTSSDDGIDEKKCADLAAVGFDGYLASFPGVSYDWMKR